MLTTPDMPWQVPTLEKQWLISPPPSPPPGWKPRVEDPPVINLALVEALQGLDPKAERELHPAAGGLPAITVQVSLSTPVLVACCIYYSLCVQPGIVCLTVMVVGGDDPLMWTALFLYNLLSSDN